MEALPVVVKLVKEGVGDGEVVSFWLLAVRGSD
jgi:hypothetical protein